MDAVDFVEAAKSSGIRFFSSVPCSILNPLYNHFVADDDITTVTATSEGEAVGISAGAWLAGVGAGVMMQNSGLGNAVNPLMSLNLPFAIPLALILTWRGEPGTRDEPQHQYMGEITPSLLDLMHIEGRRLGPNSDNIQECFRDVQAAITQRQSYSLLLAKGMFTANPYIPKEMNMAKLDVCSDFTDDDDMPVRIAAITLCLEILPATTAVIATTGKTGRELFTLSNQDRFFCQVGSMGCASAIGLGVALNTHLLVCILDGDGAALMKLGNLATIGQQAPPNLLHIVLDNAVYESTGGQQSAAVTTDFAMVAKACGYRRVYKADSLLGLEQACRESLAQPGPTFIHMKIKMGSIKGLGRPILPMPEIALRFREFLHTTSIK